jgi:hypothetical protein
VRGRYLSERESKRKIINNKRETDIEIDEREKR